MVRLIKHAKLRTLRQFVVRKKKDDHAVVAGDEEVEEEDGGSSFTMEMVESEGVMFEYSVMDVTSWRNLGTDAVDLGSGRPERVMCVASTRCR